MHLKTIENDFIRLSLAETGAEIKHLVTKSDGKEWMWEANPEFWPRTAPVLFPIVGRLSNDEYFSEGHPYPLSQHGFARDRVFEVVDQHADRIRFHLSSDYESWKFYPFDFDFFISYNLAKNWVWIEYEVVNKGHDDLFFSVGGHPGFSLPGWPETKYTLEFEEPDLLEPRLLEGGLLKSGKAPALQNPEGGLPITNHLFDKDALVFENLRSTWVEIKEENNRHNLRVHFEGFPQLGIWSKPGAPFVCIEPWYGHADLVGPSIEISKKPGILHLEPEQNFHCRYAVEIRNF
jgi:galactose mutarotase-like enzyme